MTSLLETAIDAWLPLSCQLVWGVLMAERSWPYRFKVSIQTSGGAVVSYSAVTWLSREKAIAIAVMAHVSRHGPEHGPMAIRDVEVVEAGPVGRAPDGTMILEGTDLTDRMEF